MPKYDIEILHSPTGEFINFDFYSDEIIDEEDILKQLDIVVLEVVPDEELHQLDLDMENN